MVSFVKKIIGCLVGVAVTMAICTGAQASENASQPLRKNGLEYVDINRVLANASKAKGVERAFNDAQITKKSKELEGVFLSVMLEPMFPDGKQSDLYGGGQGGDIFRTMMIQEYGKGLAEAGGIGLSKNIEKEMKRQVGE